MKQEIEQAILKKFMYNPKLRYNEIWEKHLCSSSNFDYHLKKLLEQNLIEKKEDTYFLTSQGTEFMSQLDGVEITVKKKPLPCTFIVCIKDDKVLMQKRKKQPFIGLYALPGGKIESGTTSKEQAAIEFFEECGLKADLDLFSISETLTYDENKELKHHMISFEYLATSFSGELIKHTREGNNEWVSLKELDSIPTFPTAKYFIKKAIERKEKLEYFVIRRFMKGEEFIGFEVDSSNV